MSESQFGTNANRKRKRVFYEGTDTILEGMPVSYNFNTTSNILGVDTGVSPVVKKITTTEGGQNEGKFQRVELCTTANQAYFAGVVAGSSFAGLTGPRWIDIYEANSSIVPVWTDKSITIEDPAYLESGQKTVINDSATMARIGTFLETIDRSSTAGLCLCKVDPVALGAQVQTKGAYASVTNAPALATGDVMIPVDVAGTTFYIVAMQDDGTS